MGSDRSLDASQTGVRRARPAPGDFGNRRVSATLGVTLATRVKHFVTYINEGHSREVPAAIENPAAQLNSENRRHSVSLLPVYVLTSRRHAGCSVTAGGEPLGGGYRCFHTTTKWSV